jgi:predicted 3-demethylubiquinone-9 3-methyltransferase (glyoxalase superfamily)
MEAGPLDPFNHAFSISVYCETQSEIDRIWHGFLDNGGTEEQCGWLRDRWGVCWQIVPQMLGDLISDTDRARARRVTEAMLGMIKLDIAALQAAGG